MTTGRILLALGLLLFQAAVYFGIVKWIRRNYPGRTLPVTVARILFLFFNLISVIVILARPRFAQMPPWMIFAGLYPYYLWYGATLFIGIGLLVSWIVRLPFRLLRRGARHIPAVERRIQRITGTPQYGRFDRSRRAFLRHGTVAVAGTALGAAAYGMYHERLALDQRDETFRVRGLHPGLDGFTIGFVTDIHSSIYMTREDMELIVRRLNALDCDLILLGGDYVNGQVSEVTAFGEAFSGLRARHGVFGVTGNHDFYTSDTEAVLREIRSSGVQLLRNESLQIRRNGGAFTLVGVDDHGRSATRATPIDAPLREAGTDLPRLVLCHRPYPFPAAAAQGVDLMLSGHTHGGQVVLARVGDFLLTPAALASPFVWGRYEMGRSQLYVSRGVGTVGIPVRINCQPEITRITLRAGAV
jgi:predicted MPP superfamily phosphohydrolase